MLSVSLYLRDVHEVGVGSEVFVMFMFCSFFFRGEGMFTIMRMLFCFSLFQFIFVSLFQFISLN